MTTTAIERQTTLRTLLEKWRPALSQVLPRHLSADRLTKIALAATSRQPLLLQCTPRSIASACMRAAELGLEPSGALGGAHLVPYKNGKTGEYEAQLIPDYRGLMSLARRSGEIASIEARAVHARDKFGFSYGLVPALEHVPSFDAEDPGELRAVYAIARLKDGGVIYDVMSRAEVERIRQRSRAADTGPWVSDYDEMAKKTVVRRLCKYLPSSTELSEAVELEARAEAGEPDPIAIDLPAEEPEPPPPSQVAQIKRRLRAPAVDASSGDDGPVIPVVDRTGESAASAGPESR